MADNSESNITIEIPRKRSFNEAVAASALELKKLKLLEEIINVRNIVSFIL